MNSDDQQKLELMKSQGMFSRAEEVYARMTGAPPQEAQVWNYLGIALQSDAQPDLALVAQRQAVALQPDNAAFHHDLGKALMQRGLIEPGIAALARAIQMSPAHGGFYNSLGYAYCLKSQSDQAIECFGRAIVLQPDFAMAHNNLGNVLKDVGLLDQAISHYRRAMQLEPQEPSQHSNLIHVMHYHAGFDANSILEEQRRYHAHFAQPLKHKIQPHGNDRLPQRRLRIGYVSAHFREHALGRNIIPLLQNHDRENFEIYCYSNVPAPDGLTARFQGFASLWRNISGVADEVVAGAIRDDRIDILVDLSLHSAGNRLLVFARKPAPVQVTFAGYPAGTGLSTMDYRLSDPHLDPTEFDPHYIEKTLRLPNSFWCYDPVVMGAENSPVDPGSMANPLPAMQNGFVTFGCLNNFCKVNEKVLELWSRVLKAVGGSRLLLMVPAGQTRARAQSMLKQLGIEESRLNLVDRQNQQNYFQLYQKIDIGLETFPYNGHTTTLDSLWMGVPVVTILGATAVGRAGFSQLSNVGLSELAAKSAEEFVAIASELAADLPRLAELRSTLRQKMRQSPLADGKRFAQSIESAYRMIWVAWCEANPPSTGTSR
jgi:predicted O-linked N-acetylglucosamine transferase (SPINDLY family)